MPEIQEVIGPLITLGIIVILGYFFDKQIKKEQAEMRRIQDFRTSTIVESLEDISRSLWAIYWEIKEHE